VVYEFAADAQRPASPADDPPAVVRCSQEAARWVAIAIDALDRDAPHVTDALSCRLVVCVSADMAHRRPRANRR
jgi:hypothetical protein